MGLQKHFLLLLMLCFCAVFSNAQQLLFSSLGDKVQLPAQECYNIMQDRDGYIWFSTERGLCRYSNNRLTVFDKKNGFPDEGVYGMDQDNEGILWFVTSKNNIFQFKNGKLRKASFNANYQKLKLHTQATPIAFFLDAKGSKLYCANLHHTAEIDKTTNKVRVLPMKGNEHYVYFKKKDQRLIPFKRNGFLGNKVTIRIDGEQESFGKIHTMNISNVLGWQTVTCAVQQKDFFAVENCLVRFNPDRSFSTFNFPGRILSLYTDKNNGLWVGTLKHGVYYYPDAAEMKCAMHSLDGYSVTGTCEDSEKGIWCSTLEKGIFYSKNKHLTSYANISGLDKSNTLLKQVDGKMYASSDGNRLFAFKNGIPQPHLLSYGDNLFFYDLIRCHNDWILGGSVMILLTDKGFRVKNRFMRYPTALIKKKKRISYAGAYKLLKQNGIFYSIMHNEVFKLDNSGVLDTLPLPFTGKNMIALPNENLLIGCNEGIYELDLSTKKLRQIPGITGNVSQILKTRSGKIWIATKGDGIYWLEKNLKKAFRAPFTFDTQVFFDLAEDDSGTIWAGSTIGLMRFKPKAKGYETFIFNTVSGLPSNEVYKVAADRRNVYFSTFEGLFSFPLHQHPQNFVSPAFFLNQFLVNDQLATLKNGKIHVQHDLNSFRLVFDVLTFKNESESELLYELSSAEGKSRHKISGNELFFENLASGNYRLKVWAVNSDGIRSQKPILIDLKIESPFWFTWWFISLVALGLLAIIYAIVRLIIQRIRKREESKTTINKMMAEYQMNALQAQMNPHFIFNAINTIQGYILRRNEEEAYGYLAKFSKLIRMVLNNSQESTLLLHDELEMIHLYIELEQLRFDHCFSYELQVSELVDIHNAYLPGMLIQPYIENAIWHGIVNLENSREGKLVLAISQQQQQQLMIQVTDNGVGRELAKSFQKDINHKSMAMNLTAKRLIAMNKLKDFENAQITILDLHDENGKAGGTQVTILLPIIQKYE